MRRTVLGSVVVLLVIGVGSVLAEDGAFATAIVCTGGEDRAPVGVAESFPATVGLLYCFSEVKGGTDKVVHVWYFNDKEVRRTELPVKAARWRTWSTKSVPATATGGWRVEVQDGAGKVLATSSFTIESAHP
ncbi:MAG: DUF2914 domain-containing protein [Thermoanaerobaculaceae bacterium]|nr:DUF2914 domain-containing protein [Thermoanaerobaculaceae bacterium]MDI9622197.1 DUF2914 domain-containing protein [Acidobacteriota bacterium]NLH12610.1 DUF2914 domain-containing protein [Holophagae bacterium]HPW54920.1 DUF2914 domain-containing protein [Thermoanaerobaculaceae bacterium]